MLRHSKAKKPNNLLTTSESEEKLKKISFDDSIVSWTKFDAPCPNDIYLKTATFNKNVKEKNTL